MTFLNGALAFGALAAAIPVILHILNRSRFRQVEWGAMHLLESVVKVNHKRFQFEQWILLLVRCAIPVLLALCLARPVLTGSRMLVGDAPVSMVILLDTSYSMEASSSGVQHFEKAVDAACEIIEASSRGSEISVIQTGGVPTPVFDQPVFDSKAVVRRLRALQAGYGASDMQKSLTEGLAVLAGMSHARRELIVLSDFQPSDWSGVADVAEAVRQQVDSMVVKPELSLLQVGAAVVGNVSIESLKFSKRPLGVGQSLTVRASLKNHGKAVVSNARVILKVDGTERSVSQMNLGANSETQTLFSVSFAKPGSRIIEVEVAVDDPLKTDNRFAAAVSVWDQIDVLLVDGDPSSQPLKGETDFLSVALTPFSFGRTKLTDLVKTKTVSWKSNLQGEFELAPKVIVLANVPKLTDAQATALRSYVAAGGSALICAGNRIDASWYNDHLYAERNLLSAEFGVPRGVIDERGHSARIVAQHFDHPGLQFFNEAANGDLSTAEIRQWYELRLPADGSMIMTSLLTTTDEVTSSRSAPVVMARLDNGDPLLVEKTLGDGVVVQMATAADADWSDLPMRPFFVPLMQQLVTTMATQLTPPCNIRTGDPAVGIFSLRSKDSGEKATDDAGLNLTITLPDGRRRTLTATAQGNHQTVRFEGTRRPGIYTITGPETPALNIVASTARAESDLSMLNESKMIALAENMTANRVASSQTYIEQDRLRRHGREIWKYVLMALMAFLFLELILQQRFSKVRT